MKYIVSIAVDGRIDVEVNANSLEEARELAEKEFYYTADIGELDCIGHKVVNATDENGVLTDF